MNLRGRLAKLEREAERVVRCAWCRYALVPDAPGGRGKALRPDEFVWQTCYFCGNRYRQIVAGHTPRERESLLLWYHAYDGETYRDERAYAAMRWWQFRWRRDALKRQASRGANDSAANPAYVGNYGRQGRQSQAKESRAVREHRERKAQAFALMRKAHEREERLYGPHDFPLVERLKELDKGAYGYSFDEDHERRSGGEEAALKFLNIARCMEACELVLWGEVEEATRAEIEAREAEAASLKEQRKAEKREREERQKREREEREEKYRLEREQRERERVGRETGLGPAQGRAASDLPARSSIFWKKPEATEPADDARQRLVALKREAGEGEGVPFTPDPWEPGKNEVKPRLPPDDGSDPYYAMKKVIYEQTGVWPPIGE